MRKKCVCGFTLLEVIIAVLISSFLILTAALALRAYIDSQRRISVSLNEKSKRVLFVYFLLKQLQNIPDDLDLTRGLRFEGNVDYVKFVSYVPMTGRYFPGIFGIEYKIVDGKLFEYDRPLITREDVMDFFEKEIVSDNLTKVYESNAKITSFSYYDGSRWLDSWKNINSTPVILKINFDNGSYISFPVLLASKIN